MASRVLDWPGGLGDYEGRGNYFMREKADFAKAVAKQYAALHGLRVEVDEDIKPIDTPPPPPKTNTPHPPPKTKPEVLDPAQLKDALRRLQERLEALQPGELTQKAWRQLLVDVDRVQTQVFALLEEGGGEE